MANGINTKLAAIDVQRVLAQAKAVPRTVLTLLGG